MHWSASQTEATADEVIDLESNAEMAHRMNGQIYTALSLSIQGDALDKLRQVTEGSRREAWRRIVAYYEPMNRGHKLKVARKITNPKPSSGMNALKCLEGWQEAVNNYEKRFQTRLDPDTKMGAFIQLLPDALREHLYMNADRYTSYELKRQAATSGS